MRKCNICQNNLHYPFVANYQLGRFICQNCLEQRKETVKLETANWKVQEGKEIELLNKKSL